MTQESPHKPKTKPEHCDECSSPIQLRRDTNNRLIMACACDKQRSIKVATTLPEGW